LPENNFGKLKNTVGFILPQMMNKPSCYLAGNILHIVHPEKSKISLYSPLGILQNEVNIDEITSTIDFSGNKRGTYIVRRTTETESITTKFSKK
jgi:hypothetical protein